MNRRALVMVAAAFVLSGCFPLHHTRPGAEGWRQKTRTIGILSAVRVDEVSRGGVEEENEEWTAKAEHNVVKALSDGLRTRKLRAKALSWKDDADLDEVRLLYAEVASAIWRFTYPPYAFDTKRERFDYSVGPVGPILDRAGVDVLLVAAGAGQTGADGRRLSFVAGNSTALLTLGLVDRSGNVIWFDVSFGYQTDLRSDADVTATIAKLLSELPGEAR
ncbi:hypothetical protein [Anaeromyxobacter oryzisoli]|uniref:hypothetical protein n=1 Tax=Anaeromyxobacter oryzisoli TaxID=2925408 RepID=UPI001F5AC0FA|nr:hypothetical protein [Anaeromyxobacter sp. SG63]